MFMRAVLFIGILFLSISSCTIEEGRGGRATITGKVFVEDFNNDDELIVADYAPDWKVFIVYGDDDFFSDETSTHYDGTYVFEFLYEGNYEVYAYSKCNSCPNNIEPIIIKTEITSADQIVELEDLRVKD